MCAQTDRQIPLCSKWLCFLWGRCQKSKCEHAAPFQSYYPCPVPNDAVFFPDRFYPTSEFKAYYEGLMGLPLSMLGVGVGMNLRTHCNTDDPESETSSQQRSEWSGWPTWSMHHRTRTDVQLEGLPKWFWIALNKSSISVFFLNRVAGYTILWYLYPVFKCNQQHLHRA